MFAEPAGGGAFAPVRHVRPWTVKFGSETVLLLNVSLTRAVPVPVCARPSPPSTSIAATAIRHATVVFAAGVLPLGRGQPSRVAAPERVTQSTRRELVDRLAGRALTAADSFG